MDIKAVLRIAYFFQDIRILVQNDKQFKEAYDNGADTARMSIKDLVSSKESMLWRYKSTNTNCNLIFGNTFFMISHYINF